jgi:glutamate dehydrogenase (NAD(P)+)
MTAATQIPLEQELNPWLAAEARFDEAAARLGLDNGLAKILRTPSKEITVYIPVQLDDGRLEVFVGYRVQHSIARGPAKGGRKPNSSASPAATPLSCCPSLARRLTFRRPT